MATEMTTVTFTLRKDEVDAIDLRAAGFAPPYTGNRSAALRELLRCGMEQHGIAVKEWGPCE